MNVEILSRIQFAISVGFHILFPTLNIGLSMFLVIMEIFWIKTKEQKYLSICQFWGKIFALTFGMGIVSGLVLAYQIGTNFSPFIEKFGNILGTLFTYETLTAFFLEAGFLGIMLFGWKKINSYIHLLSTILVMLGTTISTFWILSANSWMQTPYGYKFINNQYIAENWKNVIFNHSFIPRFLHMIIASYITTCFVVASIASFFLLKKKYTSFSKTCLSFSMWALLILVPIQMYIGDRIGLILNKFQPLKISAIEGIWNTQKSVPFIIFAIPKQLEQKNYFSIEIPKLSSLLNTHKIDGEMIGLTSVSIKNQPIVAPVFFSFRIMVFTGLFMLMITIYAIVLRIQKKLYTSKIFHRLCIFITPFGFISSISGWITAEMGRQPWIVYYLMRTKNAISKLVTIENVIISSILLVVTYVIIFTFYLYYIIKHINAGPNNTEDNN